MQCLGHIPTLPRPEGLDYGESAALETAGICRRSTLYNLVVEDICKDLLERDDIVNRVVLIPLNKICAFKRSSSPSRCVLRTPTYVALYDVLLLVRARTCRCAAPACLTGVKIADRTGDEWSDDEADGAGIEIVNAFLLGCVWLTQDANLRKLQFCKARIRQRAARVLTMSAVADAGLAVVGIPSFQASRWG